MNYEDRIRLFRKDHTYKDISIDGTTFHYLLCGEGTNTLVFLAGGLGVSELWFPYIEALEGEYRILTIDYPMEYRTNQTLADGIKKLLDALLIEEAIFIGTSFGGYLAQIIARNHPKKTQALCIFSTAGLTENTLNRLRVRARHANVLLFIMRTVPYNWLKPVFRRACMRHITNATNEEYAFIDDLFRSIFKGYTRQIDLHMTELLIDITHQPTCSPKEFDYLDGKILLILPKDDDSFTPDMQNELIALMPNPVVVKNMDAGHLATILRIDDYLMHIRNFLSDL